MGPDILLTLLGPTIGGVVSVSIWLNKRSAERIDKGFTDISTNITTIERKIDDFRVDVAKNYVTNDDLYNHIQGEENWHESMNEQMREVKTELRDFRNTMDRMSLEIRDRGS